ncbi:MAG TPA: undecaprenyldiphospho-muramoylpentapeptide beta-N-acetylglucosaminyltransferase [Verrucomicrobiota bacterium]|nr:undecaprenyldiphospho-muramoylpentapeptide beta-N-acetylglucosaminyltransferase [Verrucomicrobiota bacterium]
MTTSTGETPFIAIACGGTGGHFFPGLAVAEQLLRRDCSVALLISPKDVDQKAVRSAKGMEIVTLPAVALQRGSRLAFIRGFWQSWRASRKVFKSRKPDAALAMGGFTAAPPIFAARSAGARTFLHESNTIPGRANRWLARLVDQAFVGFPSAAEKLRARDIAVTGTPVRREFQPRDAAECRRMLGLDADRPVVLVMGGSQGATGINDLVLSALPALTKREPHWQWLHLAGPNDVQQVRVAYQTVGARAVVHEFLSEMELALGAATAAVSRAGASSLAELAAVRVPTLLVPYPTAADNHQFHNAQAFVNSGAARLLEQSGATAESVATALTGLMEDGGAQSTIRSALEQWHSPAAAGDIADLILAGVENARIKAARAAHASGCCSCHGHRGHTRSRTMLPVDAIGHLSSAWGRSGCTRMPCNMCPQ